MQPPEPRVRLLFALATLALLAWGGPASAQGPATSPTPEAALARPEDPSRPMGPPDPLNRGTPRGSMYGFIQATRSDDYEKASSFLDLRRLPADQTDRGPELARKLKVVLDQTLWVDFHTLSDTNAGTSADGLPAWQDVLGRIDTTKGPVDLLLQRVPREEDQVRIWKVSAATVARIGGLFEEFGPTRLEKILPPVFFHTQFLDLQLWQWCALVVLALLAWGASLLVSSGVIRFLHHLLRRTKRTLDDRVVRVVRGPVRLAVAVLIFTVGHFMGKLPIFSGWLRGMERLLFIVALAWLFLRLTDLFTLFLRQRMERAGQQGLLPVLVPSQRVVKLLVLVLAGLAVLASAGVNITAGLAGLGVGGIAVALAAQKSIENLFGGITLFSDQPIRVGDFCRFGDQVGTVEEIGLRSTRVRTLDRTVVTIPNAAFSELQLENFRRRDRMRLHTVIGVRYETSDDQMRYLLARLRELLLAHPSVTPDPARVRFAGFGAYSLDIEIFAYVDVSDWNEFLGIREDIFLRIMRIVKETGTGFAFPSSTMYLGRDEGLDEEQTREAESRVETWRSQGQLPFPRFPEPFVKEHENRLDWPPQGSPERPRSSDATVPL